MLLNYINIYYIYISWWIQYARNCSCELGTNETYPLATQISSALRTKILIFINNALLRIRLGAWINFNLHVLVISHYYMRKNNDVQEYYKNYVKICASNRHFMILKYVRLPFFIFLPTQILCRILGIDKCNSLSIVNEM